MSGEAAQRAHDAIARTGIAFTVTRHGPVSSLSEAAEARGVAPGQVIKTLVVRRAEDDYLLVLVPGGRTISWPKLRALLGVNRMTMPSAQEALEVTGYPRGAITPFGALRNWPVIADDAIASGPVSIGGGDHGVAFTVDAHDLLRVLEAQAADVGSDLAEER